MKSILTLLLAALAFATVAQPQKINYQALALGSNGKPLKNTTVSLRLSVLDRAATGTVLYTETLPATTDAGGQFSVYLGTGSPNTGTFASIPWANGTDKFLKVEMDAQGGINYQVMGTTQLVSVPYAMAAGSLCDSSKVIASDGTEWSLIIGPNGPFWQQSSGIGGLKMNYPCPGVPAVYFGGQTYPAVQIGTQCWLAKNLNVGTMIQGDFDQTNDSILEKYCYNNDTLNCEIYGGLYQWAEAMQYQNGANNTITLSPPYSGVVRGICPLGWHLPSDWEYCTLIKFLGAGLNCNRIGSSGTTALSGFSPLLGGYRYTNFGIFLNQGNDAYFWTSSEYYTSYAISYIWQSGIRRNVYSKNFGFSVRCIQD